MQKLNDRNNKWAGTSKTNQCNGSTKQKREVMTKLEILKQCQGPFHLFQHFTWNNKPIFFCAFPV